MPKKQRIPFLIVGLALAALLTGCAAPSDADGSESLSAPGLGQASSNTVVEAVGVREVVQPPAASQFDYQLGGPYTPPKGVSVLERDRTAKPAQSLYNICYVNGFQTQPSESKAFAKAHPDLVLQKNGIPIVDPGWEDEYIFDTSTQAKRVQLTNIVRSWIDDCAKSGYAAVEIDNLDSYTRSQGLLSADDNLALAREYATVAHASGLAIAQKNTADLAPKLKAMGYDFAVTESCYKFKECASYTDLYQAVFDIEYTDELGESGFSQACTDPARPASMILRDHFLVTPSDGEYVYRSCTAK
ncbi:endo alpha-1,4 polygalactosaminidase [Plantibacter sp. VKM Ac-2885]|uniref:endo alpha-1,4 polygalactosaminidase n=1 Tax=Plantibacter sp. VKM Ac-2885 TaxID=2783828 RepID=UPI00188B452C|nr:endo alpha-1,4 polygalactosaminidase [Plantibacter sp. VKM Ac-2885]MBF4514114.1 endo alpha-1,4 polygalactosaminidase [Plantibacter sp. VKM Ac-2885]